MLRKQSGAENQNEKVKKPKAFIYYLMIISKILEILCYVVTVEKNSF
jgi:hypothetical protein